MKGLFEPKDSSRKVDSTYSKRAKPPQYIPSTLTPSLSSLTDTRKYGKLVAEIKKSNVTQEEKDFLLLAAMRHVVFNYAMIADYYAHASKEMQELMEQSALVILDVDDAIANGYVLLTEDIKKILDESGIRAGEQDEK